jgi:hypothetical protein
LKIKDKKRVSNKYDCYVFFSHISILHTNIPEEKALYSMRTNYYRCKEGTSSNKLKRKEKALRSVSFSLSLFSYAYNPTTRLCLTATAATTACIYVIREAAYKTGREQMAQYCLYVHIAIIDNKSFAASSYPDHLILFYGCLNT